MKTSFRILALLCALLMVLSCFVGCKKEKVNEPDATTTVNSGEAGDEGDKKVPSSLPSYDWEGATCLVLGYAANGTPQFENFEIYREELTDDVVGKAVWQRNAALKDKYNFEVKQELVPKVENKMVEIYDSGDHIYDLTLYRPLPAAEHAEKEYLLDLTTVEYIDLDHPSWDQNANEQLAIGGHLFFTVSDFLLQDKDRAEIIFYNREMARNAGKGYLEDYVANNMWTIDVFGALVKEFSTEGNGNGQLGDYMPDGTGDNFGLGVASYYAFATFCFGAGIRLSSLDENGNIVIENNQETAINVINAVGAFMFDKSQTLYVNDIDPVDYTAHCQLFGWEKELFCCDVLSSLDRIHEGATMNEMINFEFSYLPMPKYTAAQENYYQTPSMHTGATISIPYTVEEPAKSGFFAQALTETSTDTTLNAYYEVKCKIQNAQDQRASDMLDIVFGSISYDIAVMYEFGGLYEMYADFGRYKVNRFANWFPSRYDSAKDAVDTVMSKYED